MLIYEEFYAVLEEIEGVLNSRPLAVLGEGDMEESLTPVHLLFGHGILDSSEGEGYDSDPNFNNNCKKTLLRKHQLEQVLQSS